MPFTSSLQSDTTSYEHTYLDPDFSNRRGSPLIFTDKPSPETSYPFSGMIPIMMFVPWVIPSVFRSEYDTAAPRTASVVRAYLFKTMLLNDRILEPWNCGITYDPSDSGDRTAEPSFSSYSDLLYGSFKSRVSRTMLLSAPIPSVAESLGICTRRRPSPARTKYPPNSSSVFLLIPGVVFRLSTTSTEAR